MTFSPEIIQGKGFQAQVIRTDRRKTATVKVVEGQVSVVVPQRTSKAKVDELIAKKPAGYEKSYFYNGSITRRSERNTLAESVSPISAGTIA